MVTFPYDVGGHNHTIADRESGGMADAPDLGSGAARRGGSSPPSRTKRSFESLLVQSQYC
jgi:hypothetical protein